ncbi:uncharacterized protein LOC129601279 [Paramacrobiotus metropolitanus]|uniref:uncharacterized protein LOC129601279 n=1 Tax=Paramacrobiotus metropolitanus TaxID=2943436 RepID=UPI002445B4B5|nr:uncharacterized protein LOC129601279 [Paramacrobiotus metropolitanus]
MDSTRFCLVLSAALCLAWSVAGVMPGQSLRSLERQVKRLDAGSVVFPRCVCTLHTLENVSTAGVKLMSLAYRRYPSCNVDTDCKKKTADCPDFCRDMGYKFLGKNSSLASVLNDTNISIGSEMCRRFNQPLPAPGLRVGVFYLAYSSQNSYGPRQVLKGPAPVILTDDSLCCARIEHPISSKEKLVVFDAECKDRSSPNAIQANTVN